MSVNLQNNRVAYGLNDPLLLTGPLPIIAQRAPTANDKAELGTEWIDKPNNQVYFLTSIVNNQANWSKVANGLLLITLTGDSGGAVPATANNIDIFGGTGITVAGTPGSSLLSIGLNDDVVITLTGDSGGAVPGTGNNIDVQGGTGIVVAGTPGSSLLSIGVSDSVLLTLTGDTGGAVPGTTNNINIQGARSVLTVTGIPLSSLFQIDVTGGGLAWIESPAATDAISLIINTAYISNPGDGNQVVFLLPAVAPVGSVIAIVGKDTGGYQIAQNAGQTIFDDLAATTTGVLGTLTADNAGASITIVCITADTDFRVVSRNGTFTPA